MSGFEDELSTQWPLCLDGKERASRIISAFWRVFPRAAESRSADVILVDVGPNLRAIIRSALVAADHVAVPLAADLFSVQGTENLGPAPTVDEDPYCLAQLKRVRSLMPLAQEARKPIFELRPVDGAFGGH